jgi:TRAP-type transport system small permease protein
VDRFVKGVVGLNRVLHYVAGAALLALMFMIVANIFGRWLFGIPVRGTVELTQLLMVGIVYFGLGYTQSCDEHISVDLLYLKLPRRAKTVVDLFASIVTLVVVIILAWQLQAYYGVLEAGGRETSTLGIPLAPLAWVAIAGAAAFALAVVGTLINRSRGREPDEGTPSVGGS